MTIHPTAPVVAGNPFYTPIKLIGIGFNIFSDYRQESSTEEIFDWANIPCNAQDIEGTEYDVPDCAVVHVETAQESSKDTCETFEELCDSFAATANAELHIGAFRGEARAAYSEESKSSKKRFLSYFHFYHERLYMQIEKITDAYLRKEFKDAAHALPAPDANGAAQAYAGFFDHWGTHYVKSCRLGGQLDCDIALEETEATAKSEMSVFVKAEYDGAFVSGSVDAEVKKMKGWANYSKSRHTHVRSVGGDNPPNANDYEHPGEATVEKFNKWIESLKTDPAPVHFEVAGLWTLFHDQKKADEIKKAYEDYVKALRRGATIECRTNSCFVAVEGGPDIPASEGMGVQVVVLDRNDPSKALFYKFYPNAGDGMHYRSAALDLDKPEYHGHLVFVFTSNDVKPEAELPAEFVRVLSECGADRMIDEWDKQPAKAEVRYALCGVLHGDSATSGAVEAIAVGSKETLKSKLFLSRDRSTDAPRPGLC